MDDLISRQDAIDIASGYCHPANIAEELAKLPSAQPEPQCNECPERQEARQTIAKYLRKEPQWIPCSERLPEDIEDIHPVVIICGDFGVSVGFYGEYVDGNRYWYDMGDGIERSTVKAWMPLPESYKEE